MVKRVTISKASKLPLPELWLDIFVEADPYETRLFNELFARARCRKAASIAEADIVVFGGGADVDPALYGQGQHIKTRFNVARDKRDMEVYKECVSQGIPMVGVCRGAQFLHVMNGGKLYQDVDNHYGSHHIIDQNSKKTIRPVSSVHHQACQDNTEGGMDTIAITWVSKRRFYDKNQAEDAGMHHKDIEAFFYRDTCCFGVQGHPEYREFDEYSQWFIKQIQDLIYHSPDLLSNKDRLIRMKPDLLAERKARRLSQAFPDEPEPAAEVAPTEEAATPKKKPRLSLKTTTEGNC